MASSVEAVSLAVEGRAEPVVEDALDVEVGDQQLLLELRGPGDGRSFNVEHHAGAVENQLVLPADGVDVADVEAVVGGTGAKHPLARGELARVEGRAVDVDDDLGAGLSLQRDGA